jgi:predicted transcriptional regulator
LLKIYGGIVVKKKLIVSLHSTDSAFKNFISAAKSAKIGKPRPPEYRLSFTEPKDFNRFVKNMSLLLWIKQLKPKSVYELSQMLEQDPSNVAKLIRFFEQYGIVKLQTKKKGKTTVKIPIVEYEKIEFDLAS